MPGDRSSSSPRRSDRSGGGRDSRPGGGRDSRPSGGSSRDGGRAGGSSGRGGKRGGTGGRDDRSQKDRPPLTEADRRSMEVKRRRGPKPELDRDAEKEREREKIEARTTEEWIDEGSVRNSARAAAVRASGEPAARRELGELDPEIAAQLSDALGAQRGARLAERLAQASEALDRERFDEAKRIAAAIAKEAPTIATAHEVVGLANYRLGRYKPAAASLEISNGLHENPETLPVLADCYRALERWSAVERVWLQIRESSPAHPILAEGRIVAAGALADRGDLAGAIEMMLPATKNAKSVKDHHLRQWYVLADFYDRLGDPLKARRWFGMIAEYERDYYDIQTRLRHIGR
ncbi:MAG: tetratricopeptide (TPR) repeat protein [Ilumatobacter sp.]|jgi:tetratricopeptide (TPR) repeat protein